MACRWPFRSSTRTAENEKMVVETEWKIKEYSHTAIVSITRASLRSNESADSNEIVQENRKYELFNSNFIVVRKYFCFISNDIAVLFLFWQLQVVFKDSAIFTCTIISVYCTISERPRCPADIDTNHRVHASTGLSTTRPCVAARTPVSYTSVRSCRVESFRAWNSRPLFAKRSPRVATVKVSSQQTNRRAWNWNRCTRAVK